jgi:ADP-ribose pyrophosphatase
MRLRDLDADIGHLRETTIASEQVWKGRLLDVRRDRVSLPDGHVAHREYIVHPGAVMVVAMLDAERLIVERQWRHPIGKALIEFPAGKLEAGEPVLACAVRELFEETGYRAAEWARAGITHNAIAYATEGIEIWFARGLTAGERQLDHGEFLDVLEATAEELEAAAGAGELTDAKTLIGLLWLRNWQAGRWSLQWQPAPP